MCKNKNNTKNNGSNDLALDQQDCKAQLSWNPRYPNGREVATVTASPASPSHSDASVLNPSLNGLLQAENDKKY